MDLNKIKEEVLKITNSLNLELYDIEYVKQGKEYVLRITIDKEEGIVIDDCINVSNLVNPYLDQIENEFKDVYSLEVTSAGIEKQLRNIEEIKKNVGKYVYLETKNGTITGDLVKVEDDIIHIKDRNKNIGVTYSDIKFIRLCIKF